MVSLMLYIVWFFEFLSYGFVYTLLQGVFCLTSKRDKTASAFFESSTGFCSPLLETLFSLVLFVAFPVIVWLGTKKDVSDLCLHGFTGVCH